MGSGRESTAASRDLMLIARRASLRGEFANEDTEQMRVEELETKVKIFVQVQ